MNDAGSEHANPFRLFCRVFLLFTLIYLCTWAGHYTTGDGRHKIAWAKALIGQDPGISSGQNGVYSKYGIGHSLLAIPPLAIAHFFTVKTGIQCEAALYTLIFVINGALFLGLLAFYLSHFFPDGSVWRTILIVGLATTWWPYTKMDFSEPLVLTTAFLGFVLMRFGYPALGMLVAGLTLAIRSDSAAIIIPLVLWYLVANRSLRAGVKVALSLAPSIALAVFANYIRYHSFLDPGYADERFSNSFLVGLYGILLSSGKSIFLFSPPLLLGVWGWKRFARRTEITSDAWLFLAVCTAQVVLYANWWDWSGDDCWGCRFLIPGLLLMCIPMITVVNRGAIVIPAVAAGIAVQLLAVAVSPGDFLTLLRSSHLQREALYVGGTDRVDFEDVRFDPNYSQILGNWILLRCLLHIPTEPGRPEDAAKVGTRLYDTVSPQNWAAAARWDFIWNLRRSTRQVNDFKPTSPIASEPVP